MLLAHGLAFNPVSAHAMSRFDVGGASPIRAKANLNFIIIIPETIEIVMRNKDDRGSTDDRGYQGSNPANTMIVIASDVQNVLVAYGNSGTLALQYAASHRVGRKYKTVASIVAVP